MATYVVLGKISAKGMESVKEIPKRALLHWRRLAVSGEGGGMMPRWSRPVRAFPSSAFGGFRFPPEIIVLAVRWRGGSAGGCRGR